MKKTILGVFVGALALIPAVALASPQGELTQVITAGALSTDIRDASYNTVAAPTFAMGSVPVSNACQTSTGSYGNNTQRVYVDNPDAADAGWTLSIAATDGALAVWTNGTNTYDYDNPAAAGCTGGQLTLNPAAATLGLDGASTSTGITKGTAAAFNAGSSITLATAAAGADDVWRGYLTGIGVSQAIPASTPAGNYKIDLTQTVVATP